MREQDMGGFDGLGVSDLYLSDFTASLCDA
jgi:hypothetical protein